MSKTNHEQLNDVGTMLDSTAICVKAMANMSAKYQYVYSEQAKASLNKLKHLQKQIVDETCNLDKLLVSCNFLPNDAVGIKVADQ